MPCPYCGLDPTATTEDDNTGNPLYECENGHTWLVNPDEP